MTEEKDLFQDPNAQQISEELQDYYEKKEQTGEPSSSSESLEAINEHLSQYYQATLSPEGEVPEKSSRIESILSASQPEKMESAVSHPIEKFMSIPKEEASPRQAADAELDNAIDSLFAEEEAPPVESVEEQKELTGAAEAIVAAEEGDYLAHAKPAEEAPKEEAPLIKPEEEEEISSYLTGLFGEEPKKESEETEEVPIMTEFHEAEEIVAEETVAEETVTAEDIFVEEGLPQGAAPQEAEAAEAAPEPDPLKLDVIKANLSHQAAANADLIPINHYMIGVLSEMDKKVQNVRDYFHARHTLEEMYHQMQELSREQASIGEVLKIAENMVTSRETITKSASIAQEELAEVENVAKMMKETAEEFLKAVQKTKEQIDKDHIS